MQIMLASASAGGGRKSIRHPLLAEDGRHAGAAGSVYATAFTGLDFTVSAAGETPPCRCSSYLVVSGGSRASHGDIH